MFSFFKKKTSQVKSDTKVWMTWKAKYEGFVKDLHHFSSKYDQIIIITFFKKTVIEVEEVLNHQKFNFQKLEKLQTNLRDAKIIVWHVEQQSKLLSASQKNFIRKPECLLIPEHYPLYEPEKQLLEMLYQISPEVELLFYFDLEDPLMNLFGTDRMKSLLEKMGVDENESIQHAMVHKAIQNAQKKLESKIDMEIKAASVKEWFEQNKVS